VGVEPGGGGVVDGGQQDSVLDGEPGQRLLMVGERFGCYTGLRRDEGDRVSSRIQQPVGGVRGVQVVVKHTADGGVALLVGVSVGEFCGISAEQVVEGVPAGGRLDE
jgi:hypothetical protein